MQERSGSRNRRTALAVTLFAGGLVTSLLVHKHIAPQAWWTGLILWMAVVHGFRSEFLRPMSVLKHLGKDRLDLNLALAKSTRPSIARWLWARFRIPPFSLRLLYIAVPFALVFGPLALAEAGIWGERFGAALTPATLTTRLEPPAFAKAAPVSERLRSGERTAAAVVSGTLVELAVSGGEGLKALVETNQRAQRSPGSRNLGAAEHRPHLAGTIEARLVDQGGSAPSTQPTQTFTTLLGSQGNWSGSTDLFAEAFGKKPGEPFAIAIDVTTAAGYGFGVDLQVDPSPLPSVGLALASDAARDPSAFEQTLGAGSEADPGAQATEQGREPLTVEQGDLAFAVRVDSETPLTQVELLVRTESGYSFNMPVGEFAGTDRLQFSADSVRLQTLGIPFAAKDVLYVQARAQTFVKGLDGYSTELKFPVKSPIETRKELREQLEKIREALKEKPQGDGPAFQSWKSELLQKLTQSTQTAAQLGRQSTPARALNQARDLAAKMTEPSDKQIHAIDARVRDALEALKRQDAQERAGSWFMKMRSFLEKLERSDLGATDKREAFAKDGAGLRDEALEMKNALQQMIDSPRGGLTLDEKQAALAALESDETPERVTEMNSSIDAAARDQALGQGRQALDEATEKLGSILQLMANARARMTKDARERLARADEQLEGARQSPEKSKQQSMAGAAQKALDGTPQLGESFNEALAQAQEGSRGVQSALSNNKREEVKSELDRTQRAIAEALSALQEEEQSERNERNQEEGRRYRSAMDAMNAQGQLDAGWRRKIFEEISRLRESGVPADADIIRYLESRLR